MPAWDEVLKELQVEESNKQQRQAEASNISPLDSVRGKYIKLLSEHTGRNVICYYSGWLQKQQQNMALQIDDNDINGFMNMICGLDREKGLDLILHTPGGDLAAAESIVKYLIECFGHDIRAIVPQLSMSAGTMIACACKEVLMGRQSSLGPTDPQLRGIAAGGVIEEFERAVREVSSNPASIPLWAKIIGQYPPTFLGECEKAIKASSEMIRTWLLDGMLSGESDSAAKCEKIVSQLCDHSKSAMHNRHFSYRDLEKMGMKVSLLEKDNILQDLVLTIHHAFMHTFAMSNVTKAFENSDGKRFMISA